MPTRTDRQQSILELFDSGVPASQIALRLNLSPSTVSRRLSSAGRVVNHAAKEQARQARIAMAPRVRELAESGANSSKICAELNMGADTLKKIADEHSITISAGKTGRPSKRSELYPRAKKLWDEGASQTQISEALGVPLGTLHRWFYEDGVRVYRIDTDPGQSSANLGSTSEEVRENARRGGQASADRLHEVHCERESCGKVFRRTRSESGRSSRARFCSRECAMAQRRDDSGASTEYTCETCDGRFIGWVRAPRRYCSRLCFYRRPLSHYVIQAHDVVFDSTWEAELWLLCRRIGLPCDRVDREADVISTPNFDAYAPDLTFPTLGLYVEIKGKERDGDPPRWSAWRDQKGPLAVVAGSDMDRIAMLRDRDSVSEALRVLAQLDCFR